MTPEKFSAFKKTHRTNNVIEAHHRVLRQRIKDHPSIWKFTQSLVNLQCVSLSESTSLRMGLPNGRPSGRTQALQDQLLQHAWFLYETAALDIRRFLTVTNHLSAMYDRNNRRINSIEQVNLFINAPNHDLAVQLQVPIDIIIPIPNLEDGIFILPQRFYNADFNVLLYNDLQSSLCRLCNGTTGNLVSMPCWHWFGCWTRTRGAIQFARQQQAGLRCGTCLNDVIGFHEIYIS